MKHYIHTLSTCDKRPTIETDTEHGDNLGTIKIIEAAILNGQCTKNKFILPIEPPPETVTWLREQGFDVRRYENVKTNGSIVSVHW